MLSFLAHHLISIGQDLDIDEISPDEDNWAAESLIQEHWGTGEHSSSDSVARVHLTL